VKELDHRVVFLRTLQRGGTAHSFGIHVARMAGMPQTVIACADNMLKKMERNHLTPWQTENGGEPLTVDRSPLTEGGAGGGVQMSIFQLDDPALAALRRDLDQINLDTLSPLEAFDALRELKKTAGKA
jgi:DNA mismatch repair protein MutS